MTFFLNLLYSLWSADKLSYLYTHSNAPRKFSSFFILMSPIWITWLLICGGQYGVGTDYFSYYSIFENANLQLYYNKGEWLFAFIVESFRGIGMPPQGLFYIFYFINFYFFFKIVYKINNKTFFIYILLYICLSNIFNNQLNGLRQYSAVYIVTYGLLAFYEDKSYIKYIIYIIIAGGIHFSSYLMIPFILLMRFDKLSKSTCFILLIIGIIFSFVNPLSIIIDFFPNVVPVQYKHYIGGHFDSAMGFEKTLGKYIFIPLYLLSIFSSRANWTTKDLQLFSIGIISYTIRLTVLNTTIFNRLSFFLLLLSVFPIYIHLKTLYKSKDRKFSYLIMGIFIAFYFIKTIIFARDEYLYKSIYFL